MKNVVVYLVFIFAVVFLFGFAYSFNPEGGDGKSIFVEKKCSSCHSIESADITSNKKDAVDLSVTGDTYDAEFLIKYLIKEEKIDGKEHKTKMKGTEEEIKTISEWLASLKETK
jgi:mono/diheme cytochrome c family protein